MVRTTIFRIMATTAAMAALVGLLVLGAAGQLPLPAAFGAFGMKHTDYVHGGARIVPPAPTALTPDEEDEGPHSQSLTGDDVDSALATYGIDGDGNLFEEHSPQTEVPRLAGPKL